jgi:hypothetical protein
MQKVIQLFTGFITNFKKVQMDSSLKIEPGRWEDREEVLEDFHTVFSIFPSDTKKPPETGGFAFYIFRSFYQYGFCTGCSLYNHFYKIHTGRKPGQVNGPFIQAFLHPYSLLMHRSSCIVHQLHRSI